MLSPYKFTYNGMSSLDFDVHTQFSFDGDSGEADAFSREIIATENYDGSLKRGTNFKWNNNFEPQITLTKVGFDDFSESENRRLMSWLTSKKTPSFFDFYADDSEVIAMSILGGISSISQYKLGNGRVVGYVLTITSLTPYALSDIKTVTKTITTPITFNIKCLTDELESFVYPKITIREGDSVVVTADATLGNTFENGKAVPANYVFGTVYKYNNMFYWVGPDGKMIGSTTNTSGFNTTSVVIENLTTGVKTLIKNNIAGEEVTLDGANRIVASDRLAGRIFGDDFNWNWLPLQYGDNSIRITGNCTIKFEFRVPLKTGDFIGYFAGC